MRSHMLTRLAYLITALLAYACIWAIGYEALAVWNLGHAPLHDQLGVIELVFVFTVLTMWFSVRSVSYYPE